MKDDRDKTILLLAEEAAEIRDLARHILLLMALHQKQSATLLAKIETYLRKLEGKSNGKASGAH